MTTDVEYALMAGNVYESSRNKINQVPVPPGWDRLLYVTDDAGSAGPGNVFNFGFGAGVFRQGNDIVISFTGTNELVLDWITNLGAGLGSPLVTFQLIHAANLYEQVKQVFPTANITFSGHSLGGGLAALLAVYFDKSAVVFDSAPFLASALDPITIGIMQASFSDTDLSSYNPFLYLARSLGVRDISTSGEALSLGLNQRGQHQLTF